MIKKILTCLLTLIISILIGTGLLMAAYSIPNKNIDEHVKEAAYTLSNEKSFEPVYEWCSSNLDNFTDSLMLLTAAYDSDKSLLDKSLSAERGVSYKAANPYTVMMIHYLDGEDFDYTTTYERYWHGYLSFLKPLLYFFNYAQIREINMYVQLLIIVFIVIEMLGKKMTRYIIPYLLCYFMMVPLALSKSIQYSTCFYTYNLSVLLMLCIKKDTLNKYAYLVFFLTGVLTSYLDLLTYPIITLGVPLLTYISINRKDNKIDILNIMKMCIFWGVGYITMWASKWIIASIVLNKDIIKESISQILVRLGSVGDDGQQYTFTYCLGLNYGTFLNTPFTYLMIVYMLICLIKWIIKYKSLNFLLTKTTLHYLLISIFPVIWYLFTINHSTIHFHIMANKTAMLTFMAIMFYFCDIRYPKESMNI